MTMVQFIALQKKPAMVRISRDGNHVMTSPYQTEDLIAAQRTSAQIREPKSMLDAIALLQQRSAVFTEKPIQYENAEDGDWMLIDKNRKAIVSIYDQNKPYRNTHRKGKYQKIIPQAKRQINDILMPMQSEPLARVT